MTVLHRPWLFLFFAIEIKEVNMKVLAWGAVVDNKKDFWIPIYNTDALAKGSYNGTYEYIGNLNFREYGIDDKCILKVLETNDHVLLFARASYDVWIVDKVTNKLTHQKYYDGTKGGIADIVQCGENAVILPYSTDNSIIIWNMISYDVNVLQYDSIPPINHFAFVRGIECGGYVFSATRSLNGVYVCRIDVNQKKTLFFETSLRMVNAIDIKEDSIWLFGLSSDNKTLFLKYKNDMSELIEQHIIRDIEPVLENGNMKYIRMCVYKDKIALIPSSPIKIYIYNLKTDDGYYLEYPDDSINGIVNKGGMFVEIQRVGCDILLFPFGFDRIMKLNLEDEIISSIKISFDSDIERKVNSNIILSSDIISEGYPMSLNDLINTI